MVQPGADLRARGTRSPQPSAQIDVNTLFLTDTSLAVGDSYTMVNGSHKVTAKIVGEVFAPGNDVSVYMSPATLTAIDPTVSRRPASTRSRSSRASTPTATPAP